MRNSYVPAPGWAAAALTLCGVLACEVGGGTIDVPPLADRTDDAGRPLFTCRDETTVACQQNVHLSCRRVGEFIEVVERDCGAEDRVCNVRRECITCSPDSYRCQACEPGDDDCDRNVVQQCDGTGDNWFDVETCDQLAGDICYQGACRNQCERAREDRSYVGCEFFAADLDNAAIDDLNNASAQQYAVAVANPQPVPVEVVVERNDGAVGETTQVTEVDRVKVPPGALEVFELERREVDGSTPTGLDDGTHTALTSNAYRLSSTHPITAYQFNPLENVNVFSNDASLLLPTSAVGTRYTVVAWPQTIGDSDDPAQDFDPTTSDEDLRTFLTIIGTSEDTDVTVTFGDAVGSVVGAGPIPASRGGDQVELNIGPYDVINLETEGFNADFTGTTVDASKPVTVFVGSEASDVPVFGTYATRQCCADHLEEQIFPDAALGTLFNVARMPSRSEALVASGFEDDPIDVAVVNEPEWVRVVAVGSGRTTVSTSLPFPDDEIELDEGEDIILEAPQDFVLEADQPVAVLQALPSQGVTGIPRQFPGGDPAIIAVPPVEQYRRDYIFLTPDKYAFDFLVITADAEANILLDGEPLPEHCTTDPADGLERSPGDPRPDRVVHRCQLSFPRVSAGTNAQVLDGDQNDGVHTVVADRGVGIVVYGFDRFVSYAYAGGLDLDVIN
ncbi:MAG: IgGFc-binding protein [Myxococcales bacterium]|jgi:hypothetical protein